MQYLPYIWKHVTCTCKWLYMYSYRNEHALRAPASLRWRPCSDMGVCYVEKHLYVKTAVLPSRNARQCHAEWSDVSLCSTVLNRLQCGYRHVGVLSVHTGTSLVQAHRFPGGWGSQISRHKGGKAVSPMHRPPLPSRKYTWYSFVRGWVEPKAIVRPEGLSQWKIPMTPSEIEPATFRLVASTNCATAYPDMLVVVTEQSKDKDRSWTVKDLSWTVKDLSCFTRNFVAFNLLKVQRDSKRWTQFRKSIFQN